MYTHSVRKPAYSAALLYATVLLACSGTALGKECWLDIYDQPNLEGSHARIEGPAQLGNLKTVDNQDWSNRIESLKVGSDAEVIAYRKENFEDKPQGPVYHPEAFKKWGEQEIPAYQELEITFGAGKREHHLGELDFHRNINSLKVMCKK